MLSIEQAASSLPERFMASVASEAAFRADFTKLQFRAVETVEPEELARVLALLATSLRTDIAIVAFIEALHSFEVKRVDDVKRIGIRIAERAERIAGFDVREYLAQVATSVPATPTAAADLQVDHVRGVAARHVLARLAAFPLDSVYVLTNQLDDAALAHRIHQDAEKLEALARRADDSWALRLRDAGQLFLEGRVEVADVARLLGLAPAEVAAEFERLGFIRSLKTIELGPEERRRRLQQIPRSESPVVNRALVARDVVASQRIEGIDARRHDAVTRLSLPDEP